MWNQSSWKGFLKSRVFLWGGSVLTLFLLSACGGGGVLNKAGVALPRIVVPMSLKIFRDELEAFQLSNNSTIPDIFACTKDPNTPARETGQLADSPRLHWYNPPAGTQAFAIIVDLANASAFPSEKCVLSNTAGCVSWQVYNIPGDQNVMPVIHRRLPSDLANYKPELDTMGKGFGGVVGPAWDRTLSEMVYDEGKGLSDASAKHTDDHRYYLGPCPSSQVQTNHIYKFTVYALSKPIPIAKGTPPDLNRESFLKQYGDTILKYTSGGTAEASVYLTRRGNNFYIDLPGAQTGDLEPNTDAPIPDNASLQQKIYPSLFCAESPFADPTPASAATGGATATGIYPQGVAPKVAWYNPPGGVTSMFIFLENLTLQKASQGTPRPPQDAPIYSESKPYTTWGQNISCDFELCRNWLLGHIVPNPVDQDNNILFRGGKPKSATAFTGGLEQAGNLYTYALRAARPSVSGTQVHKVVYEPSDLPVAKGYFGPCDPLGSGIQRYRISILAMNALFEDEIWRNSSLWMVDKPPFPQDSSFAGLTRKDAILKLSLANFLYYFGKVHSDSITQPGANFVYNVDMPPNDISFNADPTRNYVISRPRNVKDFASGKLDLSRGDFYHYLMNIKDKADESSANFAKDQFQRLATANYVVDAAASEFSTQDDGCELCRFCAIGVLPADPGLDLWQQYGINSGTISTSGSPTFSPASPAYSPGRTRGGTVY